MSGKPVGVPAKYFDQPRTGQLAISRGRFEGLTGSSTVGLARAGKPPSGNPFPHDMAGGRPMGEKPALRVEQSAFADGHLPTDMDRLAFPADDPRIGRHRSCEAYLVFERHGGTA